MSRSFPISRRTFALFFFLGSPRGIVAAGRMDHKTWISNSCLKASGCEKHKPPCFARARRRPRHNSFVFIITLLDRCQHMPGSAHHRPSFIVSSTILPMRWGAVAKFIMLPKLHLQNLCEDAASTFAASAVPAFRGPEIVLILIQFPLVFFFQKKKNAMPHPLFHSHAFAARCFTQSSVFCVVCATWGFQKPKNLNPKP